MEYSQTGAADVQTSSKSSSKINELIATAIKNNNENEFKELIELSLEIEGWDVDAPILDTHGKSTGKTLLHMAVRYMPKAVLTLVKHGADLAIKDNDGGMPLEEYGIETKNDELIGKIGADICNILAEKEEYDKLRELLESLSVLSFNMFYMPFDKINAEDLSLKTCLFFDLWITEKSSLCKAKSKDIIYILNTFKNIAKRYQSNLTNFLLDTSLHVQVFSTDTEESSASEESPISVDKPEKEIPANIKQLLDLPLLLYLHSDCEDKQNNSEHYSKRLNEFAKLIKLQTIKLQQYPNLDNILIDMLQGENRKLLMQGFLRDEPILEVIQNLFLDEKVFISSKVCKEIESFLEDYYGGFKYITLYGVEISALEPAKKEALKEFENIIYQEVYGPMAPKSIPMEQKSKHQCITQLQEANNMEKVTEENFANVMGDIHSHGRLAIPDIDKKGESSIYCPSWIKLKGIEKKQREKFIKTMEVSKRKAQEQQSVKQDSGKQEEKENKSGKQERNFKP